MTALRLSIAAIVILGLLGGIALVSADGQSDATVIDWMHDGIADHVPGDHHSGDHTTHHDGSHAQYHEKHHDGSHAQYHDEHHDGTHVPGEHHQDGGECVT
ncbi:hypothetical protein [Halovivax gelatinilyticus]|uniref:hypothetical protein n=1 Tax=Halovivax gelatinilyticus TaxID=2961597 RepID=UPI0020CA82E3|nr:hypothetical protein [Halovivax gelatinilyticus]